MPVRTVLRWCLLVAVLVTQVSCGQSEPVTSAVATSEVSDPGFTPPHDGAPLAGFFYVHGVPPQAPRQLAVELRDQTGVTAIVFDFAPGDAIGFGDAIGPGVYTAVADGVECDGSISLVAGIETDATLRWEPDGTCEITPDGAHDPALGHTTGSIGGRLPIEFSEGASIVVESMADPPAAVPDPTAVDEGGNFLIPTLQPGRYRVTLVFKGATMAFQDVDVRGAGRKPSSFLKRRSSQDSW
jgi:hypothetical protein